jgi:transcriptional regulator with XRE-family HTH domain
MRKPADDAISRVGPESDGQPDVPGLEKIVESIGPKVRVLRAQQKLSLQQLAMRADVSAAAIHKVERGDMVPTITTLLKLASALGRPVGHFIEDIAPRFPLAVQTTEAGRTPAADDPDGVQTLPVSGPAEQYALEASITVIEPGVEGAQDAARAPAGEELVYLLDGTMELRVGDEPYDLRKGDSLHYRTEHPLGWVNRGRKPARLLWVRLPR